MRIPGLKRILRKGSALFRRRRIGGVILAYHRVADLSRDPQALAVTPEHFSEHLAVLAKQTQLVSLAEMARGMKTDTLPTNAVAVTFDDGYADNLLVAKPLLERHVVPVTVFVTTGHVDEPNEFWWDDLERIALGPGTRPDTLQIQIGGRQHNWSLKPTCYEPPKYHPNGKSWTLMQPDDPTPRHGLYRSLSAALHPLPPDERDSLMQTLHTWSRVGWTRRETHRALTVDELVRLKSPLVEIGGHTVRHPLLAHLPIKQQQSEIQIGKNRLEEILGKRVDSFSYPFGYCGSYTSDSVDLVREAGFLTACANFEGLVHRQCDPFQFPRFLVRDWDGDQFARRLRHWFNG